MLASLASFALLSCSYYPPDIDDLRLQGAEHLEPGQIPGMDSQEPPEGAGAFLRVTISSKVNLVGRAKSGEMNVYPIVVSCLERDSGLFAYGPYMDGLHVGYTHLDRENPRFDRLASVIKDHFTYELYIPVAGQFRSVRDINKRIRPYDLRNRPEDLCVRIGGGNMVGAGFRSNEVRVAVPRGAHSA